MWNKYMLISIDIMKKIIWNKVKVLTVSTIRLLRNRVSAQQARERKKAYLLELEVRVKELEKKNSEVEERLSTLQNENQMLRHVRFLFSLPFYFSRLKCIWFDLIWLNLGYADFEEHYGWYARKEIIEVDLMIMVARKLNPKLGKITIDNYCFLFFSFIV